MQKKQKNESSKRDQFTVVLEGIRGDIRVFGEGVENLQSAFQMLSIKFDGLEERLTSQILSMKVEISQTKKELSRVSRKLLH